MTLAFLLLFVPAAYALNTNAGTSGAQFLKLGAGARAGAMADSFAAVADDAHAAYYNPAGLFQLNGAQLAGAHTAYFEGINYEVLNFAYPIDRGGPYSRHVLGLGLYHLAIADIERRSSDTTDPVGTFGASDGAYAVSYSYGASRRLGLGVTGKFISQNLDSYNSSGFAADFGILYGLNPQAEKPIKVAAVVKNLGSQSGYISNQSDPLPLGTTLGASYQALPKRLRVNLDLTKYRDTDLFAAAGTEYVHPFKDGVSGALRLGLSSQRKENEGFNSITLGAGLAFHKAAFDFAWIPFGHLGDTFRYSLIVKF